MLVNTIGYCAEAADHHPDLSVTWARVTVKLSTHSAGGITKKDFAVAERLEEVVLWRPAAGGALKGPSTKFVQGGDPRPKTS
jgi:4a-hydroxytetrahydrobiopterin dehydratase